MINALNGFTVFSLVLLVFVVVTVANGVRIIPQGEEWIVQRLGKYRTTLLPGLRFIIPYIDTISYKVTTKDIILDVQEQEVITRDNAVIVVNAISFIKVTDPVMKSSARSRPSQSFISASSARWTTGAASRLAPMRFSRRSISSAPVTTRRTMRSFAQSAASASFFHAFGVSGKSSRWTESVSDG